MHERFGICALMKSTPDDERGHARAEPYPETNSAAASAEAHDRRLKHECFRARLEVGFINHNRFENVTLLGFNLTPLIFSALLQSGKAWAPCTNRRQIPQPTGMSQHGDINKTFATDPRRCPVSLSLGALRVLGR